MPPDPEVTLPLAPVHALLGGRDGGLWVGYGGDGGVIRLRQNREAVRRGIVHIR